MRNSKAVWQVAFRPSGAQMEDGSSPQVLLWGEKSGGQIRFFEVVPEGKSLKDIDWPAMFKAACLEPQNGCQPAMPGEIQVDDEQLQGHLKACLGTVQVTLRKKLKSIDDAAEALASLLSGKLGFSYLMGTGVHQEEVAALACDMVEFLQARPFEVLHGDQVLQIEGLSTSPVFVSVLGMEEMEYGLGIYLSRQAAETYLRGITPDWVDVLPVLSLTLVTEDNCPLALDAEIRAQQWPCHPMGFPLLMRVDGERAQPTSEEIVLARELLRLVVRYAKKQKPGRYTLDGRRVTVQPMEPAPPVFDLSSSIFSQLLDAEGMSQPKKRGRSKR